MIQNNIIGVTGITGSGTSTVSAILKEHGGFVINADKLAHDVMRKGEAAYEKIVSHFGTDILSSNGEVNRKALGALVFGNTKKLSILESIIHPEVIAKTHELLRHTTGHPFSVIDAPLLIESEMHKICNSVWLITAPDDIRIKRIMSRDGIDYQTAIRRLDSRTGDDFLRRYASLVINNNADLASLKSEVAKCIIKML